jgi:intracellular septation protein
MSDEKTATETSDAVSPMVKLAIEAGPLIVFFAGNAFFGIYIGTAAFMVATVASLIAAYVLERRIAVMPIVTALFVMVFGGLTIWLNDETFIKLKPTVVSTLFGVALLGSAMMGAAPLKSLLGHVMELNAEGWRKLTVRWGLFFLFLAVLNEVVWRNVSTDTWVSFKVFGLLPLTMVFAVAQSLMMQKYALPEDEDNTGE